MHYWNKDNFEGLLDLARELGQIPELALLSEYCVLREKGLRKQALNRLNEFLDTASSWEVESARRLVLSILSADARTPEAHQFMSHPLVERLIFPVLEQWRSDCPSAVEPLRWLGLLRQDSKALKAALSLDPADVPVRRRLVDFAFDDAYHATHHLSESVLLMTVDETRASIAAARELIASAPDPSAFAYLSAEADEYEQMLNDWVAYRQSPTGTFPEWCAKHGRTYSWPTIVYYDDGSGQTAWAADGTLMALPRVTSRPPKIEASRDTLRFEAQVIAADPTRGAE
jgi:hypothetical protein